MAIEILKDSGILQVGLTIESKIPTIDAIAKLASNKEIIFNRKMNF